jgi:hypothetical protein
MIIEKNAQFSSFAGAAVSFFCCATSFFGRPMLILANSSINLPGHVSVFISESSLANPGYVNPGGLFIDK